MMDTQNVVGLDTDAIGLGQDENDRFSAANSRLGTKNSSSAYLISSARKGRMWIHYGVFCHKFYLQTVFIDIKSLSNENNNIK